MLKYVDARVVFAEVPNEITLAINISNCPCHCEGCHSAYLADDIGNPLDWGSLNALININHGITCVAFMGGDSSPSDVNKLAYHAKKDGLKTCWYSGRQELSPHIELENFDFVKLGPYVPLNGGLSDRNTNQRFYEVDGKKLVDRTGLFWK